MHPPFRFREQLLPFRLLRIQLRVEISPQLDTLIHKSMLESRVEGRSHGPETHAPLGEGAEPRTCVSAAALIGTQVRGAQWADGVLKAGLGIVCWRQAEICSSGTWRGILMYG